MLKMEGGLVWERKGSRYLFLEDYRTLIRAKVRSHKLIKCFF